MPARPPLALHPDGGGAGPVTMPPVRLNYADAGGADNYYDSNELRALSSETGAAAAIPSNRARKILIP